MKRGSSSLPRSSLPEKPSPALPEVSNHYPPPTPLRFSAMLKTQFSLRRSGNPMPCPPHPSPGCFPKEPLGISEPRNRNHAERSSHMQMGGQLGCASRTSFGPQCRGTALVFTLVPAMRFPVKFPDWIWPFFPFPFPYTIVFVGQAIPLSFF